MSGTPSSIRVMIAQLPQYAGKVVRIVGTIVDINDTMLTLRDETNAEVKVACKGHPRFRDGVIEVTGMAHANGTVEEQFVAQFAGNFNFELYREAVAQTHRFPNLYPVA